MREEGPFGDDAEWILVLLLLESVSCSGGGGLMDGGLESRA